MSLHRTVTSVDAHIIHSYEYANASARTSASGFVSSDLGRVARQLDNGSFWVLSAISPSILRAPHGSF